MRIARLLVVTVTILGTVTFLAPPATAQPPQRLESYLTDDAGALSGAGRAAVIAAVDKLYTDRHIRLWVTYVDTFSDQSATSWAQRTYRRSELGDDDALLAVATVSRSYAFLVPATVRGVDAKQVNALRRDRIEPALHDDDWSGAAVAAADGLDAKSTPLGPLMLLAGLAVVAGAVTILLVVTRSRRRRRRAADLAAARRVDPTDADALAAVSLDTLDDLSRSMVVDVDNALRTSSNELALAIDEFGEERTAPFTRAVDNARAALDQAFTVRQQLDDATPETPEERRELLTRVIVSAARADRELASRTKEFEKLRDLVINAPSRLDGLTQQYVELTARLAPAGQRLAELHNEFDAAALTPVSGNVAAAKERLAFADRNIGAARESAARAVAGQQSALVDAVRAAESALGQARALLDAVDGAANDIRHAIDELPTAVAGAQAGIQRANDQLRKTPNGESPHASALAAARDAAAAALDNARGAGSTDPLSAFARLSKADADLNSLLDTMAEEQANARRIARSLEQAMFTAESRVRAVSEYVDTRRGSVGPEARTRLAEARRHLRAARDTRDADPSEAISHASAASALAANAQALANADVRSAQHAYSRRGGGDTSAMLGGIIIGDLLSGGMRGGFGGWSPTSFGGSAGTPWGSAEGSSDGDFMGGGGRF